MNRARILLADDNQLFREELAVIINNQPDMDVVAQAEDGLEAYIMFCKFHPDLVVMDINMPISDGLEATNLIHSNYPESIIIMLTAYEEEQKFLKAIKAGAQGYIIKTSSTDGLLRGLRCALEGEAAIPRKLAHQLLIEFSTISRQSDNQPDSETISQLTRRENEILQVMASGATNQEIADQLTISIQTVKSHVSSVLNKLQAKSRYQATQLGYKQGLIRLKV